MLSRIKKNDTVVVISGKDKGKQGEVIELDRKKGLVKVRGVFLATKHKKPRSEKEVGKIVQEERFIASCKVMPVCPETKMGCRVKVRELEGNKKVRMSHGAQVEI
jgi:large subunit ribosomal protein L24